MERRSGGTSTLSTARLLFEVSLIYTLGMAALTRLGRRTPMSVTVFNPDGLHKPAFYRQVAVATGSRLVFVAGQIARDPDGNTVGAGDLAAQTTQAL
jgi:hypothetical protein